MNQNKVHVASICLSRIIFQGAQTLLEAKSTLQKKMDVDFEALILERIIEMDTHYRIQDLIVMSYMIGMVSLDVPLYHMATILTIGWPKFQPMPFWNLDPKTLC